MDKPQIVLPGDVFDALHLAALAFGNRIGSTHYFRDPEAGVPCCLIGHAFVADGERYCETGAWGALAKSKWSLQENDDLIEKAGRDLTFAEYVKRANNRPGLRPVTRKSWTFLPAILGMLGACE